MLSRMSTYFVRTLRENPAEAEVASHQLLVRAGYIRRAAPGIYTWLPIGLRVLRKIEAIVRDEMDAMGAQEVLFPALLPREPYEKTGRWTEYGPNLFRLKDRRGNDYLLAPTHEEMFALLVGDLYSSYKDLPLVIYQIQTKYRDEARPRAGLLRGREFVMKDSYSFDLTDEGLDVSYQKHRDTYQRIFSRLGLEVVICNAQAGAMGGSRSEEFLHPTPIGEDTFVRSSGGYAANVEAVTTPAPPAVDASDTPAARDIPTPDAPTIQTLVDLVNAEHPRTDGRAWTAADTLKNIVVVLTHPDGKRELLAVGLPGDRELDMTRLAASVAPAEAALATDEDLATHPELVKGYIGPRALGPNSPLRTVDENGAIAGSVRYLLDPRVVDGTSWVTGADAPRTHVLDLVAGRDFTADGVIEAAEIREGDPAPDGSSPLSVVRGMEMGHIFQLGRKYAEALGLQVLDPNGKQATVTMGSYGVGVTRALAAIAESTHDDLGLLWPRDLAPFDVHLVATGKGGEVLEAAGALAEELEGLGVDVLFDDRPKVSPGVKFTDAELLGVPTIVVVGKGLKNGVVEVKDRKTGTSREIPVDGAARAILDEVRPAAG